MRVRGIHQIIKINRTEQKIIKKTFFYHFKYGTRMYTYYVLNSYMMVA